MRKLFAVTVVAVLCSALFSVAVCEGAGPGRTLSKATWSGKAYTVGPCTDPDLPSGGFQDVNIGTGFSSFYGKSDFVAVECSFFTSETTAISNGWMVVTTANGDTVHVRIEGTFDFVTGEFTEHEEVLGGTGRFKNATGESVTTGNFVFPADPDSFPYGSGILPSLIAEPVFWVATGEGWISFE